MHVGNKMSGGEAIKFKNKIRTKCTVRLQNSVITKFFNKF